MNGVNHEVLEALQHDAFAQVMFPSLNKMVFYKFMEKVDHVLLMLLMIDGYEERSQADVLMNDMSNLQEMLEKQPFLIHQRIRDSKFKFQVQNLFKGLGRFNYFYKKRAVLHFYDGKPVTFVFISTLIDDEQEEACSRLSRKQAHLRMDHVPTHLFKEYLVDLYQFHDQQLREVKFKPVKPLQDLNDKIFMGYILFFMGISILALLESFIRLAPIFSLPMALVYLGIGYAGTQAVSWKFQRDLKHQEKNRLFNPLLYGQPFEFLQEKSFNVKAREASIEEEEDGSGQVPLPIPLPPVQVIKIAPKSTENGRTLTIESFKQSAMELLEHATITPQGLIISLRNMLIFRYGLLKNLPGMSAGVRKIMTSSHSELDKVQKLHELCKTAIVPLDSAYKKHEKYVGAVIDLLSKELSLESLKKVHLSVQRIGEVFFSETRDSSDLDEIMQDIDQIETPEKDPIPRDEIPTVMNASLQEELHRIEESLIAGTNGDQDAIMERLRTLTARMIQDYHAKHVKESNGEPSLLKGLMKQFVGKNELIVNTLGGINGMLQYGVPDLKTYFLSLVKLNKAFSSDPAKMESNIPKINVGAPIISVTHESSSHASLLDLSKKQEKSVSTIKNIPFDKFNAYWKHAKAITVIHDESTSDSVKELNELIRHLGLTGFGKFSLNISSEIEWLEIKTPLLIYRNDSKNKFIIDMFNPATVRDLIEDAPTNLGGMNIQNFEELREEIVNRIGKEIHFNPILANPTEEMGKNSDEGKPPTSIEEDFTENDMESTSEDLLLLGTPMLEAPTIKKLEISPHPVREDSEIPQEKEIPLASLEDNYHERVEAHQKARGKETSEENYKDFKTGIHPKMDYKAISNVEDLKECLAMKALVILILHDETLDLEKYILKLETTLVIRSLERSVYVADEQLHRLLLQNFGVNESDFDSIKMFRRHKKAFKVISTTNFWKSLQRDNKRILNKRKEEEMKIPDVLIPPKSLLGVIIAQFDNQIGAITPYESCRVNGGVIQLISNIFDDSGLQHMQVSMRQYNDYKACFIIRKEESEEHERNRLSEAYLVFLKLSVKGNFMDLLEENLASMVDLEIEDLKKRGRAFYHEVIKFMEAHEHEI